MKHLGELLNGTESERRDYTLSSLVLKRYIVEVCSVGAQESLLSLGEDTKMCARVRRIKWSSPLQYGC
jgi:hypothetical protein